MDAEIRSIIILAGGKGSRMGSPKGLLRYENHFWLEEQIRRASMAGANRVVLVLGYQYEEYLKRFSGLDIKVCINEHPELGQFSSIQVGARASSEAAFILPVDVPCAGPEVFKRLSQTLEDDVKACVPTYFGVGGHPVLLSKEFLKTISEVDPRRPEARLDVQLHGLSAGQVKRVPVQDPLICVNINTPADWEKFKDGCA